MMVLVQKLPNVSLYKLTIIPLKISIFINFDTNDYKPIINL